jgi:hypothetical protein
MAITAWQGGGSLAVCEDWLTWWWQGDIIIIATDGLYDNVDLDEICR